MPYEQSFEGDWEWEWTAHQVRGNQFAKAKLRAVEGRVLCRYFCMCDCSNNNVTSCLPAFLLALASFSEF